MRNRNWGCFAPDVSRRPSRMYNVSTMREYKKRLGCDVNHCHHAHLHGTSPNRAKMYTWGMPIRLHFMAVFECLLDYALRTHASVPGPGTAFWETRTCRGEVGCIDQGGNRWVRGKRRTSTTVGSAVGHVTFGSKACTVL